MRLFRDRYAWLFLSACLTTFISAEDTDKTEAEQWRELTRRNLAAEDQLTRQQPQGVKKMSDDPGEKFWPHFWEFESLNASIASQPFALHLERRWADSFAGALFRRDGTCPSGYSACTSINQPNSCCPNGNTCITVQDTGNGPVGCCPAGQTCGNTISGCDTSQGYSSCPNSDNKGCCIPGYACSGSICVNVGTQVITASTSTTTSSSSSSTSSPVSVVTVVSVNNSGFTTTATVTATVTVSPSSSSTSASAAAPVRPTSSSDTGIAPASVSTSTSTSTITTTTSASSSDAGYCPTGYYMCSAVYLGGCCQVDRDCNTTSCPSTASTTVINGSPTVIAPTGASSANVCANGWYSCPASLGGSCCPTGYGCAQTNCPAEVTGVAAQSKQAPSQAAVTTCVWSFLVVALVGGIGMIVL